MNTVSQAFKIISGITFASSPESVPLNDAQGRFLYETAASPVDIPAVDETVGNETVYRGQLLSRGNDFLKHGRLGPGELSILAAAGFNRVLVRSICSAGIYACHYPVTAYAAASLSRAGGWPRVLPDNAALFNDIFPVSLVSYERFSEDVLSSQWRLLFRGLDFVPAENISCYGHSDGRIIFILSEHLLAWAAVLELLVRPLIARLNGTVYRRCVIPGIAGADILRYKSTRCIPVYMDGQNVCTAAGAPDVFRQTLPPFSCGFIMVPPGDTPVHGGDRLDIIPW